MVRVPPLSALLLSLPALAGAGPLDEVKTKAQAHYLAHEHGAPTIDAIVKLPPGGGAEAQELELYLAAAREVQLGCVLPCSSPEDIAVFRSKAELVAVKLGLDAAGSVRALDRYVPRGRPRLRAPGAPGPSGADKLIEGKVLETLLRSQMDPKAREALGRKAVAYAEALGRTSLVTADGAGVGAGMFGNSRALSTAELTQLNNMPGSQARILRHLVANPPPPPMTAAERQAAAMLEAEKFIEENPGTVREARNTWIRESRDANNNFLWRGYAYFNRGLLAVTGLTEVEESAARLGWATASSDVSTRRAVWEGTKLFGNSAMFAANFVGLSGATQVVQRARALDNPVVIDGVGQLTNTMFRQVSTRIDDVNSVVTTAVNQAGKRDIVAATKALDDYVVRETDGALRVLQGGKWGQADFVAAKAGRGGEILYSPMFGKAHEFTHAHQMVVNRMAALEHVAAQTGRPIASLTDDQVRAAMELASRFEKGFYAQHEAQALRSSGVLGLFPGSASTFGTRLAANGTELKAAWSANPAWNFTGGQKFFGALSGMGESQLAIAGTLSAHANIPIVRDQYGKLLTIGEQAVSGYLPEPTLPSGAKR